MSAKERTDDAVVDRSRPGIVKRQTNKSIRLEAVQDFVADRAVQHLLQMLNGAKQKRHRQHVRRRHEGSDQRYVDAIEVDGAGAGLFDGLLFFAELMRMKDPDLVAAPGAICDQAAHVAQRLYGRIFLILGIGGAKFARDRARRDRRQKQRHDDCYGPRKAGAAVHRQLHPLMMSMAGKKGSMQFSRSRRKLAILSASLTSSIVRCDRSFPD